MERYRHNVFLACKTRKWTKKEATEELHRSDGMENVLFRVCGGFRVA